MAATLSLLLWTACQTRTVRVEVPTPVPVAIDRCPEAVARPLPPLPKPDPDACVRAYGADGARDTSCFDRHEAHRLAALLDALIDLHTDVAACPPAAPTTPTEGVRP